MGYAVLYIAFGIVALWLLGEVLLQYKARLRWRLLAFSGFLGVVVGVALRDVFVIVLGALAFGAGQSFVTLSYKRGFSTGWSLGGRPGSSRRRKGGPPRAAEPVLEVSPVEEEYAYAAAAQETADPDETDVFGSHRPADSTQVYQPQPLHEDSGEYPLYDGQTSYTADPYTSGGYEGYGAHGYAGWGGEPQPAAAAYTYDAEGQEQSGWGGQQYGYDQAAAAHQDPAESGYGYGGRATGDWTPQQQPQPQHTPPPQPPGQPPADPYGYGYPQPPQQQPYIPQQQYRSPYEQQPEQHPQPQHQPQHQPHPQQYAEQPEYADPYDPYRY